jgi:predicted nucleic acid-binding protein
VSPVVYDAAVLVAADRNERRVWAEHRVRLESGVVPAVPAPVLAQVSRSRTQVQLRRLLAGCEVVAFDEAAAHRAGAILARGAGKDVVDASVVDLAIRRGADVVTRDVLDIARLAGAMGARLRLLRP